MSAAVLGLAACGGDPEAAETVGPTSAPPSEEPTSQAYEPTLPPYTSEVALDAEDEASIEELLLLIDEFNILTSTLNDESVERARALEQSVESELFEWHVSDMESTLEEGIQTRGVVVPTAAKVLEYSEDESTVSICYSFDDYEIFDEADPSTPLYTDRPDQYSFETDASIDGDHWVISDRRDSRILCEEH